MKTKEEERALCQSIAESYLNDPAEHPRNGLSFLEDMLVAQRAAAREEMKEAVLDELTKLFNAFIEHPDCAQMFAVAAKQVRALKTGVEK